MPLRRRCALLVLLMCASTQVSSIAVAQAKAETEAGGSKEAKTVAKANNQLTAAVGVNIQDYAGSRACRWPRWLG